MLKRKGIEVIVLSKEKNPVVAARCRKLGIVCIQGCDDKLSELKQKAESRKLKGEEIAYVGNDVNDLECMKWVGCAIAVGDAMPEVRSVAKWVTSKPGGWGAVREICDAILAAKRETLE
jgi:YrbI family 3-deoxy-D-manno-octulosonate 8-phosphate phosphatase